jgi:hypothetical protein
MELLKAKHSSNLHERRRPILQGVFSTAVRRATPEVQSVTPPRLAHRVPTSHAVEADGLYNALGPFYFV